MTSTTELLQQLTHYKIQLDSSFSFSAIPNNIATHDTITKINTILTFFLKLTILSEEQRIQLSNSSLVSYLKSLVFITKYRLGQAVKELPPALDDVGDDLVLNILSLVPMVTLCAKILRNLCIINLEVRQTILDRSLLEELKGSIQVLLIILSRYPELNRKQTDEFDLFVLTTLQLCANGCVENEIGKELIWTHYIVGYDDSDTNNETNSVFEDKMKSSLFACVLYHYTNYDETLSSLLYNESHTGKKPLESSPSILYSNTKIISCIFMILYYCFQSSCTLSSTIDFLKEFCDVSMETKTSKPQSENDTKVQSLSKGANLAYLRMMLVILLYSEYCRHMEVEEKKNNSENTEGLEFLPTPGFEWLDFIIERIIHHGYMPNLFASLTATHQCFSESPSELFNLSHVPRNEIKIISELEAGMLGIVVLEFSKLFISENEKFLILDDQSSVIDLSDRKGCYQIPCSSLLFFANRFSSLYSVVNPAVGLTINSSDEPLSERLSSFSKNEAFWNREMILCERELLSILRFMSAHLSKASDFPLSQIIIKETTFFTDCLEFLFLAHKYQQVTTVSKDGIDVLDPDREDEKKTKVIPGLKKELLCLISNMCYLCFEAQELVRVLDYIPLILNHCVFDDYNPRMKEWAIFTIRNLTENNEANQEYVKNIEGQKKEVPLSKEDKEEAGSFELKVSTTGELSL